jgi:hypothetical protein
MAYMCNITPAGTIPALNNKALEFNSLGNYTGANYTVL